MHIMLSDDYSQVRIGRGDGPPLTLTLIELLKFRKEVNILTTSPMGTATITRSLKIERRREKESPWQIRGSLGYWNVSDQEITDLLEDIPQYEEKMFRTLAKQATSRVEWQEYVYSINEELENYHKQMYDELSSRDHQDFYQYSKELLETTASPESQFNILEKIYTRFKDNAQTISVLINLATLLMRFVAG